MPWTTVCVVEVKQGRQQDDRYSRPRGGKVANYTWPMLAVHYIMYLLAFISGFLFCFFFLSSFLFV